MLNRGVLQPITKRQVQREKIELLLEDKSAILKSLEKSLAAELPPDPRDDKVSKFKAKWYGPWKSTPDENPIKYCVKDGIVFLQIPSIALQDAEEYEYIASSVKIPHEACPAQNILTPTVVRCGDDFMIGTIVISSDGEISISVGANFEVFQKGQETGHPYARTVVYFI